MPFPPPSAAFQFRQPLNQAMGNYDDPAQISAIQAGLANIGLGCSQNNPTNIKQILDTVAVSGASNPGFSTFRFTGNAAVGQSLPGDAPAAPTDKTDSVDWEEVGPNDAEYGYYSKLAVIIDNADWVIAQNLYPITCGTESNSIKSSTFEALQEAFMQLGGFLSEIDQTDGVDPAQIAGTLGAIIANAEATTQKDYIDKNTFVSLLVAGETSSGQATGIGITKWSYSLEVKDYTNKKKLEHSSEYSFSKATAIFTDPDVMNNVYNAVQSHLNSGS